MKSLEEKQIEILQEQLRYLKDLKGRTDKQVELLEKIISHKDDEINITTPLVILPLMMQFGLVSLQQIKPVNFKLEDLTN